MTAIDIADAYQSGLLDAARLCGLFGRNFTDERWVTANLLAKLVARLSPDNPPETVLESWRHDESATLG